MVPLENTIYARVSFPAGREGILGMRFTLARLIISSRDIRPGAYPSKIYIRSEGMPILLATCITRYNASGCTNKRFAWDTRSICSNSNGVE